MRNTSCGGNDPSILPELKLEPIQHSEENCREQCADCSRVFVDVAIVYSKRKKKHCCYDPQTNKIFRVDSLAKLYNYYEVYIDIIPTIIYNEVLGLLEKGSRVYVLRDTRLIKKMRMENNLRKSDENDVYILSLIPKKYFRELTARDVEVKTLVHAYLEFDRDVIRLKQKARIRSGVIDYSFYEDIAKEVERKKNEVRKKILKLMERDRFYREVVNYFGYKESLMIAMLIIIIDFSRRIHRILDYLGLHEKAGNSYNHRIRSILAKLGNTVYLNARKGIPLPEKYLRIVNSYPAKKARVRIETEIIKDMRKILLKLNNQ